MPKQALASTDRRWTVHPLMERMKAAARAQGLWNLWISPHLAACIRPVLEGDIEDGEAALLLGAGLSNLVRACRHRTGAGAASCRAAWHALADCPHRLAAKLKIQPLQFVPSFQPKVPSERNQLGIDVHAVCLCTHPEGVGKGDVSCPDGIGGHSV